MSTNQSVPVVPHADHLLIVVAFREGRREPLGVAYQSIRARFPARYPRYQLDATTGDELFQEATAAMLANFCRPTFVLTCPLEAYLHAIFHRRVQAYWRKSGKQAVRFPVPDDLQTEATDLLLNEEEEERAAAWRALLRRSFDALGERCRSLLDLAAAGTSAAEIARRLNMTNANAVYQARYRCRDAWDRLIRNDPYFHRSKPERW